MILAAPLMLLGLLLLPLLWWLLRAIPPAPRAQPFPAIRLLAGLRAPRQEAMRAPPWLLLLRIAAVALLVLGLAQPVLVQGGAALRAAPRAGGLLIVLDDGWAAARDWPQRITALDTLLARAGRAGEPVRLLTTAPDDVGALTAIGAPRAAALVRADVDARRPNAWNTDRMAAARALDALVGSEAGGPIGRVVYVADGLATQGDAALRRALHRSLHQAGAAVSEWRASAADLRVMLPPVASTATLTARIGAIPEPVARPVTVSAQDADGGTLARVTGTIAAGAHDAAVPIRLPVEVRNRIARLVLAGTPGPAGLRLLDEGDRRRPVGLLSDGPFSTTPLVGPLFYLQRAMSPDTELRVGDAKTLLSRQLSVLIATDGTLQDAAVRARVARWVKAGGMLIRFAGPRMAAESGTAASGQDGALLPAPLLDGARTLGGAMSWSKPEHLAPFEADTPFAGLKEPPDVTVSRQVLAKPATDLAARSWARLADGTPLVTHAGLGAGQLVLFHVTSTPDWSSLPFSGLFVQMLHRLVERSVGLATRGGDTMLAPVSTLDGDGIAGQPPPSARGLPARDFGHVAASAAHPPGLYGPASDRRALNTGDALPPLAAAAPFGAASNLAGRIPDRPLGPWLLAAALLLLAFDLIATLWLRGLLRLATATLVLGLLALAPAAQAQAVPAAALQTRLGYIVTGDAQTDLVSREGLQGLSAYVNARTAAVLGPPDSVQPGKTDLAFYPLLYWPIIRGETEDAAAIAALNSYMDHGGILLIDTLGSDAGNNNGANGDDSFTGIGAGAQALRATTRGLDIPPLKPVDRSHVLSHTFYLLRSFPGRYVGAPVWVAANADAGRDNVSPVIIGANDWAASWAIDAAGDNPYAVIPGGEAQRTLAYRFGVNAVMYALTGNYKADQVHVPALLERLGE
ncbi:DUF4159 domain-containing protein [Lichenicoccus sp.]|uniref:DUF4159 domain-containing protein n=1 Tax=Lichenicoccus sp. TaxID=2781899 RepID=UPI003D0E4954